MNKFPMLVFAFGLPLLGFLVLKDGSGTLYKSSGSGLSYQVIDPEELVEDDVAEPEEVTAVEVEQVEDPVVVEAEALDDPTPEVVVEAPLETAPTEEAPATENALLAAALTEEEMIAGKKAVRACTSCHQLERDRNAVGPHLVGITGRAIGSVEGFRYSEALLALNEAGEIWTQENMQEWLADPSAFADGTKMNFKVRDAEKRRLIAGYLAGR